MHLLFVHPNYPAQLGPNTAFLSRHKSQKRNSGAGKGTV
jgi:hypothetical protein